MTSLLSHNVLISVLGWTLLHNLWQSFLIGSMLLVVRWVLSLRAPNDRYVASCVAMMLTVIVSLATAHYEYRSTTDFTTTPTPVAKSGQSSPRAFPKAQDVTDGQIVDSFGQLRYPELKSLTSSDRFVLSIDGYLPFGVSIWLLGLVVIIGRNIRDAAFIDSLHNQSDGFDVATLARFKAIAQSLGIRRSVEFRQLDSLPRCFSRGWLRPLVYLPASVIAGYSVAEVDAIVTHELVHIRRHDCIILTIQTILEAVCFFSPGIWIISQAVTADRELAVDAATAKLIDRRSYSSTLLRFSEETAIQDQALALNASDGSIHQRMKALNLGQHGRRVNWAAVIATLTICVTCGIAAASSLFSHVEDLRIRAHYAQMPPSVLFEEVLGYGQPSPNFAQAYVSALQAASSSAPANDPRYKALETLASAGVDFDLVWRDYAGLIGPNCYPTVRSEYPSNWKYADIGTHIRLIRALWKDAETLPSGLDRQQAARAALGVGAMSREVNSIAVLRKIITDPNFESISGFNHEAVKTLRRYWSVSSDSVGYAYDAVNAIHESVLSQGTKRLSTQQIDSLLLQVDDCGDQLPEFKFLIATIYRQLPPDRKPMLSSWIGRLEKSSVWSKVVNEQSASDDVPAILESSWK